MFRRKNKIKINKIHQSNENSEFNFVDYKIENLKDNDEFTVFLSGDWHLGNRDCDRELLDHDLDEISKTNNSVVLLLGDLADSIFPGDKRFNFMEIDRDIYGNTNDLQIMAENVEDQILSRVEKIKDKTLMTIDGNHEEKWSRIAFRNLNARIEKKFGIPYLGRECFVRLWLWDQPIVIVINHGWGGGRTQGAKANKLSQLNQMFIADIIVLGHHHQFMAMKSEQIMWPNDVKSPRRHETLQVVAGSYLRATNRGYRAKLGLGFTVPNLVTIKMRYINGEIKKWAII